MTTPQPLPPYSGDNPTCPKCSNSGAYTDHQYAVAAHLILEDGRSRPGPLPERLERRCSRCDFTWDEALNPPAGKTQESS